MSRSSILIILGVLIMLAPVSGLPPSWIYGLIAICGLLVAGIGFSIRVQKVKESKTEMRSSEAPSETSTPSTPHGVSPI